jgi:hypothetical protein
VDGDPTKRARARAARWMAMPTKRARSRAARGMVTATSVVGDKKDDGDCKEEGDGNRRKQHGQWLWQRGWQAFDSGKDGDGAKDTAAHAVTGERGMMVATDYCYVMRNFGTHFTGTYVFLLVPHKSACCTILLGFEIPVLEIQSHC